MPVGDTIKLFVCWPPLEHNLKLLDDEPPGPERLTHIFDRLEEGRCVIVSSTTPLYLSSGCIHAVVTLRGGFMYAGNFMTPNNSSAFIRSLRVSPAFVRRYDDPGRRGLTTNLLNQVEIGLERQSCWGPMTIELIKSWSVIEGFSKTKDRQRLAEWLRKISNYPEWQQVCAESSIDTARLDEIIRVYSKPRGSRS